MIHLFYIYGVWFISELAIQFFRKKNLDDIHNFVSDLHHTEDTLTRLKKKISPFAVLRVSLDWIWFISGLFTPYTTFFISIIIMNIAVPSFMVNKPKKELVKIHLVWTLTQIILVSIVLYLYFSPLFIKN